jgi:hypothetical protein
MMTQRRWRALTVLLDGGFFGTAALAARYHRGPKAEATVAVLFCICVVMYVVWHASRSKEKE